MHGKLFSEKLRILEETIISLRNSLKNLTYYEATCGSKYRDHLPPIAVELSKAIISVSQDIANLKGE